MGHKSTNSTPKKRRPPKQVKAQFIELLSKTCNVTLSARGAGIDRKRVYDWYKEDAEFAAAWEDAIQQAIELLEAEAWNRARKQSDTLLIFLLKAHKPEKYRETTRLEHTGADGAPIPIAITKMDVDEL